MFDRAQNRNLRIITGQLALTPTNALRVEAGFQSFGCLRDQAAAAALERLLRLDPATHPRAVQANSGVTRQFKRGTDARLLGKEVVGHVGRGLDAWSGERGVGLSLYPLEVAAAQMTLQQGSLQMC
jgi:hypothetical protein